MREGITHLERKMTLRFTERHLLITCSSKQMSIDTYISGKKVIKVIETLINMVSWPYHWDLAGEKIDFLTKIIPSDQFNLIWTFQSEFTHSQPTFALGIWLWRERPSVGRTKHRIPPALCHPAGWTDVIKVHGAISAGERAGKRRAAAQQRAGSKFNSWVHLWKKTESLNKHTLLQKLLHTR